MYNSPRMQVVQSLQQLRHYVGSGLLLQRFGDDLLEDLAALAELQNEDVAGLVVVDLEQPGDVGMVQGDHYSHFCEQFLVLALRQRGLLDLLGRPQHPRVLGAHLRHRPEPALPDFPQHRVVLQIVFLFHFDEGVPLDLDLLDGALLGGRLFLLAELRFLGPLALRLWRVLVLGGDGLGVDLAEGQVGWAHGAGQSVRAGGQVGQAGCLFC